MYACVHVHIYENSKMILTFWILVMLNQPTMHMQDYIHVHIPRVNRWGISRGSQATSQPQVLRLEYSNRPIYKTSKNQLTVT